MISPQGYSLGEEPKSKNPFWGDGEDADVNMIFASASVQGETGDGPANVQTRKTIDGHNITFGFLFKNIIGKNGVSPTVTVTDITGGHRITIVDATSTHTFDVMDGEEGMQGNPGVSPDVSVREIVGGHIVTITDATGSESFTVMNGQDGAPGADGTTPVITITATQDGDPVTVTKTGTDAAPNFAFAFTGGGGASGTVGWGSEKSTNSVYPVRELVKKITSSALSENFSAMAATMQTATWTNIYCSCDLTVSVALDELVETRYAIKQGVGDSGQMSSWQETGGFVISGVTLTDNNNTYTFSNIVASVNYLSDDNNGNISGLSVSLKADATTGGVTEQVTGNTNVFFSDSVTYDKVNAYQNLEVLLPA